MDPYESLRKRFADKGLTGTKARVGLALDFDHAGAHMFKEGLVQQTINRLMPLAMGIDDNKSLDLWVFSDEVTRLESATENNYKDIAHYIVRSAHKGITRYEPLIKDIDHFYIEEQPMNLPNLVIVLTNGDTSDKLRSEHALTQASQHPIFFAFVGIGDNDFSFLQKLDCMDGRVVDNASFMQIDDLESITDAELFSRVLTEYPDWLTLPEVQTMLKDVRSLRSKNKILLSRGFFGRRKHA